MAATPAVTTTSSAERGQPHWIASSVRENSFRWKPRAQRPLRPLRGGGGRREEVGGGEPEDAEEREAGGAEGAPASRSDHLRAEQDLALPVVAEPVLRRRLQALARGRRTIGDVFREALQRGLDTMEATR